MELTNEIRQISRVLQTPFLVMDLKYVEKNYYDLVRNIKDVRVFYAVKANSHPRIISLLRDLGSSFDVASRGEIEKLLSLMFQRKS